MIKRILLLIAVLMTGTAANAQDQLYKKDNTKLLVKIQEVGTDEVKYKLFNNPNGPVYIEHKNNIAIIIFENGQSETFYTANTADETMAAPADNRLMSRKDSMAFFKYQNSVSINFLNIFNNEVQLIYQREFFKSRFNLIVPLSVGLEKPDITQNVYFNNSSGKSYNLDRKLFEAGFGIHYYPYLNSNINYFVGPVFRYMQYGGKQTASFYTGYGTPPQTITLNSTLSRYSVSITNGIVVRTKSRVNATFFASLGFKNDMVNKTITNPYTGTKIDPITTDFSLYFWSGINVGFCF